MSSDSDADEALIVRCMNDRDFWTSNALSRNQEFRLWLIQRCTLTNIARAAIKQRTSTKELITEYIQFNPKSEHGSLFSLVSAWVQHIQFETCSSEQRDQKEFLMNCARWKQITKEQIRSEIDRAFRVLAFEDHENVKQLYEQKMETSLEKLSRLKQDVMQLQYVSRELVNARDVCGILDRSVKVLETMQRLLVEAQQYEKAYRSLFPDEPFESWIKYITEQLFDYEFSVDLVQNKALRQSKINQLKSTNPDESDNIQQCTHEYFSAVKEFLNWFPSQYRYPEEVAKRLYPPEVQAGSTPKVVDDFEEPDEPEVKEPTTPGQCDTQTWLQRLLVVLSIPRFLRDDLDPFSLTQIDAWDNILGELLMVWPTRNFEPTALKSCLLRAIKEKDATYVAKLVVADINHREWIRDLMKHHRKEYRNLVYFPQPEKPRCLDMIQDLNKALIRWQAILSYGDIQDDERKAIDKMMKLFQAIFATTLPWDLHAKEPNLDSLPTLQKGLAEKIQTLQQEWSAATSEAVSRDAMSQACFRKMQRFVEKTWLPQLNEERCNWIRQAVMLKFPETVELMIIAQIDFQVWGNIRNATQQAFEAIWSKLNLLDDERMKNCLFLQPHTLITKTARVDARTIWEHYDQVFQAMDGDETSSAEEDLQLYLDFLQAYVNVFPEHTESVQSMTQGLNQVLSILSRYKTASQEDSKVIASYTGPRANKISRWWIQHTTGSKVPSTPRRGASLEMEMEMEQLRSQNEELQSEISELRSRRGNAAELEQKVNAAREVQEQLARMSQQLSEEKQSREVLAGENQQLGARLKELEREREKLLQESQELQRRQAEMSTREVELKAQKLPESELRYQQEQVKAIQREQRKLQEAAKASQKQLELKMRQISDLQTSLNATMAKQSQLKRENDELNSATTKGELQRTQLLLRNEQLIQQMKELQGQLDSNSKLSLAERLKIEAKLTEKTMQADALQKQMASVEEKLSRENATLQDQLAHLNLELRSLQTVRENHELSRSENQKLEERVGEMTRSLQALRSSKAKSDEQLGKMKDDLKSLKTQHQRQQERLANYDKLREEKALLEQERKEMTESQARLTAEIDNLGQQAANSSQKSEQEKMAIQNLLTRKQKEAANLQKLAQKRQTTLDDVRQKFRVKYQELGEEIRKREENIANLRAAKLLQDEEKQELQQSADELRQLLAQKQTAEQKMQILQEDLLRQNQELAEQKRTAVQAQAELEQKIESVNQTLSEEIKRKNELQAKNHEWSIRLQRQEVDLKEVEQKLAEATERGNLKESEIAGLKDRRNLLAADLVRAHAREEQVKSQLKSLEARISEDKVGRQNLLNQRKELVDSVRLEWIKAHPGFESLMKSCDVFCMLSPQEIRRLIDRVPEVNRNMATVINIEQGKPHLMLYFLDQDQLRAREWLVDLDDEKRGDQDVEAYLRIQLFRSYPKRIILRDTETMEVKQGVRTAPRLMLAKKPQRGPIICDDLKEHLESLSVDFFDNETERRELINLTLAVNQHEYTNSVRKYQGEFRCANNGVLRINFANFSQHPREYTASLPAKDSQPLFVFCQPPTGRWMRFGQPLISWSLLLSQSKKYLELNQAREEGSRWQTWMREASEWVREKVPIGAAPSYDFKNVDLLRALLIFWLHFEDIIRHEDRILYACFSPKTPWGERNFSWVVNWLGYYALLYFASLLLDTSESKRQAKIYQFWASCRAVKNPDDVRFLHWRRLQVLRTMLTCHWFSPLTPLSVLELRSFRTPGRAFVSLDADTPGALIFSATNPNNKTFFSRSMTMEELARLPTLDHATLTMFSRFLTNQPLSSDTQFIQRERVLFCQAPLSQRDYLDEDKVLSHAQVSSFADTYQQVFDKKPKVEFEWVTTPLFSSGDRKILSFVEDAHGKQVFIHAKYDDEELDTITAWDLHTKEIAFQIQAKSKEHQFCRLTLTDNGLLYTLSSNGDVDVWSCSNGEHLSTRPNLLEDANSIFQINVNSDGSILVAFTNDHIWFCHRDEKTRIKAPLPIKIVLPTNDILRCFVACSQDEVPEKISDDKKPRRIYELDLFAGTFSRYFEAYMFEMELSKDEQSLFIISEDDKLTHLEVWDIPMFEKKTTLTLKTESYVDFVFTSKYQDMIYLVLGNNAIMLYNLKTQKVEEVIRQANKIELSITGLTDSTEELLVLDELGNFEIYRRMPNLQQFVKDEAEQPKPMLEDVIKQQKKLIHQVRVEYATEFEGSLADQNERVERLLAFLTDAQVFPTKKEEWSPAAKESHPYPAFYYSSKGLQNVFAPPDWMMEVIKEEVIPSKFKEFWQALETLCSAHWCLDTSKRHLYHVYHWLGAAAVQAKKYRHELGVDLADQTVPLPLKWPIAQKNTMLRVHFLNTLLRSDLLFPMIRDAEREKLSQLFPMHVILTLHSGESGTLVATRTGLDKRTMTFMWPVEYGVLLDEKPDVYLPTAVRLKVFEAFQGGVILTLSMARQLQPRLPIWKFCRPGGSAAANMVVLSPTDRKYTQNLLQAIRSRAPTVGEEAELKRLRGVSTLLQARNLPAHQVSVLRQLLELERLLNQPDLKGWVVKGQRLFQTRKHGKGLEEAEYFVNFSLCQHPEFVPYLRRKILEQNPKLSPLDIAKWDRTSLCQNLLHRAANVQLPQIDYRTLHDVPQELLDNQHDYLDVGTHEPRKRQQIEEWLMANYGVTLAEVGRDLGDMDDAALKQRMREQRQQSQKGHQTTLEHWKHLKELLLQASLESDPCLNRPPVKYVGLDAKVQTLCVDGQQTIQFLDLVTAYVAFLAKPTIPLENSDVLFLVEAVRLMNYYARWTAQDIVPESDDFAAMAQGIHRLWFSLRSKIETQARFLTNFTLPQLLTDSRFVTLRQLLKQTYPALFARFPQFSDQLKASQGLKTDPLALHKTFDLASSSMFIKQYIQTYQLKGESALQAIFLFILYGWIHYMSVHELIKLPIYEEVVKS